MRNVEFQSEEISELSGRTGKLQVGNKEFETPLYLPIINLITGPPPVFRQGGIWKNIKKKLIKEENVDPFMTQILHFLDFGLPKEQLENWRKKTFEKWIDEKAGYNPTIFADSGGFKLLFYEGIDTSKYDISANPEDILRLQLDFGADIIATLDYPITPDLIQEEKEERKRKTIQNSLKTLQLLAETENKKAREKFVLLPIHGYDFKSSFGFTNDVLNKIKKEGYDDINFGLAIGSLVPLSMNQDYKRIIDIVAGIIHGIKDNENFDHSEIPLHAFGVSSLGMPILAAMGVDSFDSASYANSARNLKYKNQSNNGSISFYDLEEVKCNCKYCNKVRKGGLGEAKEILQSEPMKKYKFDGEKINKSEIYALIACHNYQKTKESINRIQKGVEEGNLLEILMDFYISEGSNNRFNGYINALSNYYDNLLPAMQQHTLSEFSSNEDSSITLKENVKPISQKPDGYKSLSYSPEDYNVFETLYKPSSSKVLLLTSCSKEKPYSSSKTINLLKDRIEKLNASSDIEIVVISGLYGPVPLNHDNKEAVKKYDYKLHESNEDQIELVKNRTIKFLNEYENNFEEFIAYVTSKPYRKVVKEIEKNFPSLTVLPNEPNTRTVREFQRKENLRELENSIKKVLKGGK